MALAYLAEGFNAFVLRYAVGPESPFEMSFGDYSIARPAICSTRAGDKQIFKI